MKANLKTVQIKESNTLVFEMKHNMIYLKNEINLDETYDWHVSFELTEDKQGVIYNFVFQYDGDWAFIVIEKQNDLLTIICSPVFITEETYNIPD